MLSLNLTIFSILLSLNPLPRCKTEMKCKCNPCSPSFSRTKRQSWILEQYTHHVPLMLLKALLIDTSQPCRTEAVGFPQSASSHPTFMQCCADCKAATHCSEIRLTSLSADSPTFIINPRLQWFVKLLPHICQCEKLLFLVRHQHRFPSSPYTHGLNAVQKMSVHHPSEEARKAEWVNSIKTVPALGIDILWRCQRYFLPFPWLR